MERYIDTHGLPGLISTFGFGYALDSKLLQELSQTGGGQYSFIPDAGLVGTIFVHAIANIMTTALRNCTISIEENQRALGHRMVGNNVEIGTVHYGQPKNVIIDMANNRNDICLKIVGKLPNKPFEKTITFTPSSAESNIDDDYWRLIFVQECWKAFNQMPANADEAKRIIQKLGQDLEQVPPTLFLKELLIDIKGQATEAFKPNYFEKWGRHYIPSLLYAHANQICNNFKDPGVQKYGGDLFRKIRDVADDLFSRLPAPKPTIPVNDYRPGGSYTPMVSMASYNNAGYVCFHKDCQVETVLGTKKVSELVKGDKLKSGAIVDCVVQSKAGIIEMVQLGDLILTPWHPILLGNAEWTFPIHLQSPTLMEIDYVYSVLVSGPPSITVSGYTCATLGHNFSGPVIGHEFFGTSKVRLALESMKGWENGRVIVQGVIRNAQGLIMGLRQ